MTKQETVAAPRRVYSLRHQDVAMASRVLMFGTDEIAAFTFRSLLQSLRGHGQFPRAVSHLEVVCPGDKRRGRGSGTTPVPVKRAASAEGVAVHTLPTDCHSLKGWCDTGLFSSVDFEAFDVAVVCSFGFFMPNDLLSQFQFSGINMHPSLLPKYRGAAPIDHALLRGDETTGVSVIELDPHRFDAGRILLQRSEPISVEDTYSSLSARLAAMGGDMVVETLSQLPDLQQNAQPQIEDAVVRAPKLSPARGRRVDWGSAPVQEVFNLWRALGQRSGVWGIVSPPSGGSKRVRFTQLGLPTQEAPCDGFDSVAPGAMAFDKASKSLWIRCVDGWMEVKEVQVQGKARTDGASFGISHVHGKKRPAGSVRVSAVEESP